MTTPAWKPRASSMGYYTNCTYRAAYDRSVALEIAAEDAIAAWKVKESSPSPNADLGTCIHFVMMDGMGCVFPGPSADHAPEESQWLNASVLFGGDMDLTKQQVFKAATLAARHMPKAGDGKPWLSEHRFKLKNLQGGIDFLSQDKTEIWDLKTTSKPPLGGRAKYEHIIQLCCYHAISGGTATKGGILYVDAKEAKWAMPVPLDFTSPVMAELCKQVLDQAAFLRSTNLWKFAFRNPGPHCSDQWCPYKGICHDAIVARSEPIRQTTTRTAPVADLSSLFQGTPNAEG
jgi:hypothetical protein